MREGSTSATFTLKDHADNTGVEVLGEHRSLTTRKGAFIDGFSPGEVRLYRLSTR